MTKATDKDWQNLELHAPYESNVMSRIALELRSRVEALEQQANPPIATGNGADTDGLLDRMLNAIELERGNGCYQQSRCAIQCAASWLQSKGHWDAAKVLTQGLAV